MLIRLCLTSERILIDGNMYQQNLGLAMGKNLSMMLAIIYMKEINSLITKWANKLKRYINDFCCHKKLTLESPKDNQLPFLDTLVSFNLDRG